MDRTCVSKAALRKQRSLRRLNALTPNVGDRSRKGNPATNGCPFVHGLLRPGQGCHAGCVVAHFLNPAKADAVYVGPSRERTANGRPAVALASNRVHSCDRRKGLAAATSARPGGVPGSPQREPALPTETAQRAELRGGARSSHPFGAVAGFAAQIAGRPGQGCSPANGTPEEA